VDFRADAPLASSLLHQGHYEITFQPTLGMRTLFLISSLREHSPDSLLRLFKDQKKRVAKPLLLFLVSASLWPCGVLAVLTNNLDPEHLSYNLKTTIEAYQKFGRKDPKWDADAKRCLTDFARIRASTNGTPEELMSYLKMILPRLNKCDDPMVRYLFSRFVFTDTHSPIENADVYESVANAIQQSEYPEIRKFYATIWAYRMRRQAEPRRRDITNLLEKATFYLAKALQDEAMPPGEADEGCEFLMSGFWWAEGTRWDCYRGLEPALTNRWKGTSVALLTKGEGYLSYAWQARGIGYADSVGEKGWQSMAQRLNVAAEALEDAWKLNPHDTRICREMMRVELGQGKGRDRLETWFRRGMQVDPANHDLCANKLEYLRPRWYGSIPEMIAFGRECTVNTNWSGSVRLMLADAHNEASREIQDNVQRAAYWKQTNVWSDIRFTFEQFFKLYPQEVGYRHNYAMYASRCGQWSEFMNQVKLFPSTNYSYFGGVERFNGMVRSAQEHANSK